MKFETNKHFHHHLCYTSIYFYTINNICIIIYAIIGYIFIMEYFYYFKYSLIYKYNFELYLEFQIILSQKIIYVMI